MKRLRAIGTFLAVAGCGVAGSQHSKPAPSYFPMSANRSWEYHLRNLTTADVQPVVVRSRGTSFVPEIGKFAAIFDEHYPDEVLPVAFFLAEGFLQSEIGLRYRFERRMERMPTGTQPMRVMPMPPEAGMRWSYAESVFGGRDGDLGFEIRWKGEIHREDRVIVPAGVFRNCLRIHSIAFHRTVIEERADEYHYVDGYAPDVGLVKSEYSFGQSGDTLPRLELVTFAEEPADRRIPTRELGAGFSWISFPAR